MAISYFDSEWSYGVPNCPFDHPKSPHIGFGGSRMKTVATRAINVYSRRVSAPRGFSRYMALGATNINIWT